MARISSMVEKAAHRVRTHAALSLTKKLFSNKKKEKHLVTSIFWTPEGPWGCPGREKTKKKDELLSLEELEASLGAHKLVANVICPWDTAIIIHCRWMGSICWFASSAHLPSWVSDVCFEQSVEEVLEAGRSKASGSIFLGVDANCNIDDCNGQRGVLV